MIHHPFTWLHLQSAMPLTGGCMAHAWRLISEDNIPYFCKEYPSDSEGKIAQMEVMMLTHLAQAGVPVPKVIDQQGAFLLLEYIPATESLCASSQRHLAEITFAMHQYRAKSYGFIHDNYIGTLPQPNPQDDSWSDFFKTHRLAYITQLLFDNAKIQQGFYDRMCRFLNDLSLFIPAHPPISLLHGDLWTGNILCHERKVQALIDPAIFYGHAEQDLAYSTLFNTTDQHFFDAYHALSPIDSEFWSLRKDIYILWPILCHVHWFGSSYIADAVRIIARLGY